MCIREVRQVQIVPGKPITWVCPVQVVYTCESVPKNDVDVSLASAIESMPDEPCMPKHTAVSVQRAATSPPKKRRLTPGDGPNPARRIVLVPHKNSAFERVHRSVRSSVVIPRAG